MATEYEDLLAAINGGNVSEANRLIETGLDLNAPCDNGATPLYAAILNGHNKLVRSMLDRGADPNYVADEPAASIYTEKPLDLAKQARFLMDRDTFHPIVQTLIEYGATGFDDTTDSMLCGKAELPAMLLRITVLVGYALGATLLVAGFRNSGSSTPNLALPDTPYATPVVPQQFAGQIRYLSKSQPGEYDTDDGPKVYRQHHRNGWDDCLLYFHNDWCDFTDAEAWQEMDDARQDIPWLIGAPPHIVTARRHGWLACADKIVELSAKMSAGELRKSLPVRNNQHLLIWTGVVIVVASLFIHVGPKSAT